jgi:flavin reductase (DIM6/NTAB) family NADH-FMN oxidoreductase RutF
MGRVATPVAVVTAMDGDAPHGTTVSAFASLSLDPVMMVVSLDKTSELLAVITRTGRFGVNVLTATQAEWARAFATKGGPAKFAGVPWSACDGVPRLPQADWLACEVAVLVEGGDHLLVLGAVTAAEAADGAPLTYHRRGFGTHAPRLSPEPTSARALPSAGARSRFLNWPKRSRPA